MGDFDAPSKARRVPGGNLTDKGLYSVLWYFNVINLRNFVVDRPLIVLDPGHGHSRIGMHPRLSVHSTLLARPSRTIIKYGHHRPFTVFYRQRREFPA
jgi:hypothetical protein